MTGRRDPAYRARLRPRDPPLPHVVAWPGRTTTRRLAGGTGTRVLAARARGPASARNARDTDRAETTCRLRRRRDPGRHGAARDGVRCAAHRRRLRLVGELAAGRPTRSHLVTLHPLPTHGGFMDSHVLRKASWRLPALAGVAVLRFNTRGTTSPARAPARARSTTPWGSGSTSRPPSSTPSSTRTRRCRTAGCSAGRSAPTWR